MIRLLPKSGKAQLAVMESDLLRIQLTNFGAAIFSVQLKKENGELEDLVLTCDSLESFLENRNFYGATVGRVVNRIRGGHAEICGTAYQLALANAYRRFGSNFVYRNIISFKGRKFGIIFYAV